jgi:hypothetical protein
MGKFQTSFTKPKNAVAVFGLPYRAVHSRLKLPQYFLTLPKTQNTKIQFN